MVTKGTVISADKSGYATVEVQRRAMCDGCPKNSASEDQCAHTCAMGALLGSAKNMTVRAKNTAGAKTGDKVELETKDKTVLISAFQVFILPLVLAFAFYFVCDAVTHDKAVSGIAAVVGVALSLCVTALAEKKAKKDGARIEIVSVIAE